MARFEGDRVVILHAVSWAEFERRYAAKDESRIPTMHYLDGVLELVTPSRDHNRQTSWIARLVEVYALFDDIELSAYGNWTLKDALKRAGAEPDECYILGDDSADKLRRPHLAIEVQWSRRGVNKLEVYRRLGVHEVWFWEDDAIAVYVLRRRKYVRVERSGWLPALDLAFLCMFLDRPTMTRAMRDYRAALTTS